jgi:hypothetical protein
MGTGQIDGCPPIPPSAFPYSHFPIPIFDLSLSLAFFGTGFPFFGSKREANHSVESGQLEVRSRIEARINEKIKKIFKREDPRSAERGPCTSVTESRKTVQYLGPLESFNCAPSCASRL